MKKESRYIVKHEEGNAEMKAMEIDDFKLKITESLLIGRVKPALNKADSSLLL